MDRSNRWPSCALAVATFVAAWCCAAPAEAAFLWADYNAGAGSQVWRPDQYYWYDAVGSSQGGAGVGVNNAGGSGHNAWQVTDSSTSVVNPYYFVNLSPSYALQAGSQGWRLQTEASVVDAYRDGPAMGLLSYFNNLRYGAAVGLDPLGRLVAELYGQGQTHVLAPAGASATATHAFELRYRPETGKVSFLFDGGEVSSWSGVPLIGAHPDSFLWGSTGVNQRGVMRFHTVEAAIGPFPTAVPGDFNGDGGLDAADYTLWRDTFGQTGPNLPADANGDLRVDSADLALWRRGFSGAAIAAATAVVPEPSGAVVALLATATIAIILPKPARIATQGPQGPHLR
ncbi:hypothetical protein Pla175_39430 [Pirellulimonas nuda]|uniref:Vibrio cholerae neuraminidase lectin-like domain-containing protein n=1 Tax=Pirellulimonas nuda TaxID=2528009 RepID=A0A518DGD4_9BACT|nr:hypothetical protein [Pirellulimonas nuda]QDU90537.1 hypothetical protein Pla175_39430 [Pirellulimonas nuda]